jgi:Ni/Co efflux regulator RcnB
MKGALLGPEARRNGTIAAAFGLLWRAILKGEVCMKQILIAGAGLALLVAAPVMAQHDEHREHGAHQGGTRAMSAGHPDRNPQHGAGNGMRGPQPGHNPTPQAAPQAAAQSNAMMMRRGDANQHRNEHRDEHGGGSNRSERGRSNNHMAGPSNHMAGPQHGMRGPSRGNERGHAPSRARNFNSYHRNFTSAHRYHGRHAYHRPRGWYAHRWTFGERLPPAFFVRDYWINDYFDFGLVPPPFGAVWVRYGDDALLIDETTGEVIQVVYNVFF